MHMFIHSMMSGRHIRVHILQVLRHVLEVIGLQESTTAIHLRHNLLSLGLSILMELLHIRL